MNAGRVWRGWAVEFPGGLMFVSESEAEGDAWDLAFPVPPTPAQVERSKRRGAKAFRVEIREVGP